jgi:GDP-mannose 6-dehydrogenase
MRASVGATELVGYSVRRDRTICIQGQEAVNISVFGLGFVGTVTAAGLANRGHNVIGVDIDRSKVEMLSKGLSPVREPKVEELLASSIRGGRVRATTDLANAVAASAISLICINVETQRNGEQNTGALEQLMDQIGVAISQKEQFHAVAIRSTILPSTTRRRLLPILERIAGTVGDRVGLAHHPEFMREGSAVADFQDVPRAVIGELDSRTADILVELFGEFSRSLYRTTPEISEAVKYADNAWHALKVTFANEIATLCHPDRIDSHALMELFCADDRLNISNAYLKPGFGFGGPCLGKDLRAFVHWGKAAGLELPLLSSIDASNNSHLRRSIDWLIASGKQRFAVLGLAYKPGTEDLRSSPYVYIVRELRAAGRDVRALDGDVSAGAARRSHTGGEAAELDVMLTNDLRGLITWSDTVVICSYAAEYRTIYSMIRADQIVLDFARISAADAGEHPYHAFA